MPPHPDKHSREYVAPAISARRATSARKSVTKWVTTWPGLPRDIREELAAQLLEDAPGGDQ